MESELSLANCIPLHISHDADACFRIVGCTCLGGTFLAGAPPAPPLLAALDVPPSLQPSLSHPCHPGKAHLGRAIHISVKLHLFLFHQGKKRGLEFASLPLISL